MGLILAIYTNNAYQEVHLPSTDNADYDVWLRAKNTVSVKICIFLWMYRISSGVLKIRQTIS